MNPAKKKWRNKYGITWEGAIQYKVTERSTKSLLGALILYSCTQSISNITRKSWRWVQRLRHRRNITVYNVFGDRHFVWRFTHYRRNIFFLPINLTFFLMNTLKITGRQHIFSLKRKKLLIFIYIIFIN